MSFKNIALTAGLGVSLLAACALPALADHDDREEHCRRDVQKAEERLERAVRKHGERSRQAEDRRHQLEEVRERCHMRGDDRDHDRDHR
jgi:hypothetical protein